MLFFWELRVVSALWQHGWADDSWRSCLKAHLTASLKDSWTCMSFFSVKEEPTQQDKPWPCRVGSRAGRGQALVPRQARVPWAQHPSLCHPQDPALAGWPQPSCPPSFPSLGHGDSSSTAQLPFPPATFPEKQTTTPKPTFFPSNPPTFCLPHPLPHYLGSCFCLSWLFWAGGSLGKAIRFKCRLLRMWSVRFLPAERSWIDKWGLNWLWSVYLSVGTWLAESALKGIIHWAGVTLCLGRGAGKKEK